MLTTVASESMKRKWAPLVAAAVVVAASAYAYGLQGGGSLQERLTRYVIAALLQIIAPVIAALGCSAAAGAYAPGDRERTVWQIGAAAAVAWTIGRLIFTGYQWLGGTALPYPSIADWFFVVFYLLIAIALALEVRLVLPMVDRPMRLALMGLGAAGWFAGFLYILEPIVVGGAAPAEKLLAAFYPTVAVFLIPAGLAPAIGFRGGTSAYSWVAVAASALCLAAASLGYAFLASYGLYSDLHAVNALWVLGFVCLALGGFWQRTVQEEV